MAEYQYTFVRNGKPLIGTNDYQGLAVVEMQSLATSEKQGGDLYDSEGRLVASLAVDPKATVVSLWAKG